MTASERMTLKFTGDGFVPPNRPALRFAREHFTEGESYEFDIHHRRSKKMHDAFFATVRTAWENLPEALSARFASDTHLRKWALCKAGFANKRDVIAVNDNEALKIAAIMGEFDSYAVVIPKGNVVTIWTAHSQSEAAMGAAEFKTSKDRVLTVISQLIGVSTDELKRNGQGGA